MRIKTKLFAVSAHSENEEEAELLLSLRSATSLRARKRGYTSLIACDICEKTLKNETGLAVHKAKIHGITKDIER